MRALAILLALLSTSSSRMRGPLTLLVRTARILALVAFSVAWFWVLLFLDRHVVGLSEALVGVLWLLSTGGAIAVVRGAMSAPDALDDGASLEPVGRASPSSTRDERPRAERA